MGAIALGQDNKVLQVWVKEGRVKRGDRREMVKIEGKGKAKTKVHEQDKYRDQEKEKEKEKEERRRRELDIYDIIFDL